MNSLLNHFGVSRQKKLKLYHGFWLLLDVLTVIVAYTATFFVRTLASFDKYVDYFLPILAAAILTAIFLQMNGAYKHIWQLTSGREVHVLVEAAVGAGGVLLIAAFVITPRPLPLSVIIVGQLLSLLAFTAFRYRARLLSGLRWRFRAVFFIEFPETTDSVRTLIVGAGRSGQYFVVHSRNIGGVNGHGVDIIGFVDDDESKYDRMVEGKTILGQTVDIPEIVKQYEIELIVLAIHNVTKQEFRNIVEICQNTDAKIRLMPDPYGSVMGDEAHHLREVRIEDIIGRPSVPLEKTPMNMASITGKSVLITGAAGSIGSELARQLIGLEPQQLILLDNNESGLFDIDQALKDQLQNVAVVLELCDVTDMADLTRVFETYKPQVVFHAAAYKHVPLLEAHPYQAVRINIGGTLNTAKLAQQNNAERYVLISSDKAVNSNNVMGATKYICEKIVQALASANPDNATLMCAVRFGNVVGSRGSVVPLFEKQIDKHGPVTVTDKEISRYFMSIPEAAQLVIQAACMTKGLDLFLLEMGEEVLIYELAERMIRLRGLRPGNDIPIVITGLRPGETLHEGLLVPGEVRCDTHHPYIFTVEAPQIDVEEFLDTASHLLNGYLKSEKTILKGLVTDLARRTQHQATQ